MFSRNFSLDIELSSISEPERFPGVGVVIKETFLCVPVENSIITTISTPTIVSKISEKNVGARF